MWVDLHFGLRSNLYNVNQWIYFKFFFFFFLREFQPMASALNDSYLSLNQDTSQFFV